MAYTRIELRQIYDRTSGYCHICHRKMSFTNYGCPGQKGAWEIEHSVPRSKGGTHTWENVVAACRPCNARKEDRFLADTGMKLRRPPSAPRQRVWILVATGGVRPDWEPYLGEALSA